MPYTKNMQSYYVYENYTYIHVGSCDYYDILIELF